MMHRLLIGLCWVLAALSLRAGTVALDSLTVGSTTYSNVTVFGANATDLFFSSDHGMSNVKLKFLSPELQLRFNYNSNAAEKIEEQQIADEKRYQEGMAAAIRAKAKAAAREREARTKAAYSQAGFGDAVSEDSQLGQKAPLLSFTNWVGGKPDLAGKITLISVWSPQSASCRKWIAPLNDLRRALAGKVEVVGVAAATEDEVMNADPKPDFPSAVDPKGNFMFQAGVTSLPCVLLVDTNNVVRYMGHPAAVTTNSLKDFIKSTEE